MPFDRSLIKHLVVLTMENRSFDHMLGSLELEGRPVDGVVTAMNSAPNFDRKGNPHLPKALAPHTPVSGGADPRPKDRTSEFEPDPPHDQAAVATQMSAMGAGWANRMDGFIKAYQDENPYTPYPEDVLGYYTRTRLPFLYFLADNFAVCDKWFCSVPTGTMPNRLYALCGDSGGHDETPIKDLTLPLRSIFDELHPDDWAIYCPIVAGQPLTAARFLAETKSGLLEGRRKKIIDHCRPHQAFSADAAPGGRGLPKLTFFDPRYNWLPDGNDDHPPNPIEAGQRLIRRVYEALLANPTEWASTVMVITYDEHGGFYDHVPPPAIPKTSRSATDNFQGWKTYGPRVPTLIVSPLAGPGQVIQDVLEHTSILRFVCDWLNLDASALSPRVENATSIEVALDQSQTAGPAFPRMPAAPPAVAAALARPVPQVQPDQSSTLKAQFELLKEK